MSKKPKPPPESKPEPNPPPPPKTTLAEAMFDRTSFDSYLMHLRTDVNILSERIGELTRETEATRDYSAELNARINSISDRAMGQRRDAFAQSALVGVSATPLALQVPKEIGLATEIGRLAMVLADATIAALDEFPPKTARGNQ